MKRPLPVLPRLVLTCLLMSCLVTSGLAGPAAAQEVAADVESGAKDFAVRCASCHGRSGKGDGPAASSLVRKPADLTAITARNGGTYPAGRVFGTIEGLDMPDAHGTRDMPVWGDVFLSEKLGKSTSLEDAVKATDATSKRILALVRYIETIQEKP
jgi:mono/diheme cytochrome c family protein